MAEIDKDRKYYYLNTKFNLVLIGTSDWYLLAVTYTSQTKFCVYTNVEIFAKFCSMKLIR